MADLVPTQPQAPYDQLVVDLKVLIETGQLAALNAVNEIRVSTYWQMGRRMKELADADQEARTLIARLSGDLGLDQTLLYRIFQLSFRRKNPHEVEIYEEIKLL